MFLNSAVTRSLLVSSLRVYTFAGAETKMTHGAGLAMQPRRDRPPGSRQSVHKPTKVEGEFDMLMLDFAGDVPQSEAIFHEFASLMQWYLS